MVVHDLSIVGVPVAPDEAQTPLVVDPYTVLALAVTMQSFQAITRRSCHISQLRGAVQLPKLPARDALNGLKAPARLPLVKSLSLRAAERLDHED